MLERPRPARVLPLTLALLALGACGRGPEPGEPAPASDTGAAAAEQAALEAGIEAVAYGLPLVIMDATRRKATNVAAAGPQAAPVNQFAHMTAFPDASFRDVVRANVDTLYSAAWLDLSREPMVLSVPDTGGRYYLMPMIDAWTNIFASPGKRTTGTGAGSFAITGPGWSGTLPEGLQRLESPTNMVWIIGRTQTNGPADYAAVREIQAQYRLVPLSAYGKPYTPPAGVVDPAIDMSLAPVEAVGRMDAAQFFDTLARLMQDNPPPPADAPVLAKLATIGVVPGQKFDPSTLDPAVARGLERALPAALAKLTAASQQVGAPVNGWRIPSMNLADFGTDYGTRAVVALVGLGANLPADAVYPSAFVDADGQPLDGSHRYVIHFDKGQEPPVRAFWSITLYDRDSFFVANAAGRYALSSWMPFVRNADGSLDLYVQAESPGRDREANWLPAPAAGPFNLTLRMYWPSEAAPSIVDGSWQPPAIRKVP
jgi:hypothetical protein